MLFPENCTVYEPIFHSNRTCSKMRPECDINFYAQKQLQLSARLSHRNSVRLSVCPSVTRVYQTKTVQIFTINCLEDSSFRSCKAFL